MFASANWRPKYYKQKIKKGGEENASRFSSSYDPAAGEAARYLKTRRLRNLTTILHLSLLRRDIPRAEKAFAILLRSESDGVKLSTLWELGLEILLRSTRVSASAAEEFLGRVRLTTSDIGRQPAAEKQIVALFSALLVLMIRKGKIREALVEVNNDEPTIRYYAKMLAEHYEALQREEEHKMDTPTMDDDGMRIGRDNSI